MTKAEFIAKATEYGYMDEDIEEMIELVEDANQDGVPMSYDISQKTSWQNNPHINKHPA